MYHKNFELLLEIVPANKIPLMKNLLSSRLGNDITLHDYRGKLWQYWGLYDTVQLDSRDEWAWIANDFQEKLSENMYVFEDLVVFIEHKDPEGYIRPVVKLLSLSEGYIRIQREEK